MWQGQIHVHAMFCCLLYICMFLSVCCTFISPCVFLYDFTCVAVTVLVLMAFLVFSLFWGAFFKQQTVELSGPWMPQPHPEAYDLISLMSDRYRATWLDWPYWGRAKQEESTQVAADAEPSSWERRSSSWEPPATCATSAARKRAAESVHQHRSTQAWVGSRKAVAQEDREQPLYIMRWTQWGQETHYWR